MFVSLAMEHCNDAGLDLIERLSLVRTQTHTVSAVAYTETTCTLAIYHVTTFYKLCWLTWAEHLANLRKANNG